MKQWLIDFLKELERLIPPPTGAHHAIVFARYGSDDSGWDDRLALQVNREGVFIAFFLDDSDFSDPPAIVALAVDGLVRIRGNNV